MVVKKAQDLQPGDRFLYVSSYSGKEYWLRATCGAFQSKQDADSIVVFTDLIGVLSAVTLKKEDLVEIV